MNGHYPEEVRGRALQRATADYADARTAAGEILARHPRCAERICPDPNECGPCTDYRSAWAIFQAALTLAQGRHTYAVAQADDLARILTRADAWIGGPPRYLTGGAEGLIEGPYLALMLGHFHAAQAEAAGTAWGEIDTDDDQGDQERPDSDLPDTPYQERWDDQ